MNFVQITDSDWWLLQPKGKIFEKKKNKKKTTKHSTIFFSEAIWGMKLKLCINVYDFSLYIKCVFIAVAHVFSLLWQLKVSIDL